MTLFAITFITTKFAVIQILDDKGVKFALGNAPEEFIGEDGHLKSVKVADGTEIPANVCVLGVGKWYHKDLWWHVLCSVGISN